MHWATAVKKIQKKYNISYEQAKKIYMKSKKTKTGGIDWGDVANVALKVAPLALSFL